MHEDGDDLRPPAAAGSPSAPGRSPVGTVRPSAVTSRPSWPTGYRTSRSASPVSDRSLPASEPGIAVVSSSAARPDSARPSGPSAGRSSTPPPAPGATTRPPGRGAGRGTTGRRRSRSRSASRAPYDQLDGTDDRERSEEGAVPAPGDRRRRGAAGAARTTARRRRRSRPSSAPARAPSTSASAGPAGDQQRALRARRPADRVQERIVHGRRARALRTPTTTAATAPPAGAPPGRIADRPTARPAGAGRRGWRCPRTRAGPPSQPAQSGANQRSPAPTSSAPAARDGPHQAATAPAASSEIPASRPATRAAVDAAAYVVTSDPLGGRPVTASTAPQTTAAASRTTRPGHGGATRSPPRPLPPLPCCGVWHRTGHEPTVASHRSPSRGPAGGPR